MYAFHDILERNETLWDYKNKKLKKREIRIFPKGIVHVFGQKFEHFLSFYSRQTGQNNTSHDILEGKNVYLDNKNKKLKKSKN